MQFGQFYNQIEFNNINYKEELESGVDFKNLNKPKNYINDDEFSFTITP